MGEFALSKKNILLNRKIIKHKIIQGCFNKYRPSKKGSYIVEAAVILPAFVITVFLLISIILAIGTWENLSYGCIEELRLEMAKNPIRKNLPALPVSVYSRVQRENHNLSFFYVSKYKYLYRDHDIDDLILIAFKGKLDKKNPLGAVSTLKYSGKIVGRAFSGTYYGGKNDGGATVYIFPDKGEKYHNENCGYLNACCRQVFLNGNVKKKYHSCPNCKSKNAPSGSPVFCFERTGRAYHMADCKAVKKYYIGISKGAAVDKGYTPCSKCGG